MTLILYAYPLSLAVISVLVACLEWFFPWRPEQKQFRKGLLSDFLHLVFNGHFLGLILFGISARYILPSLDHWLAEMGMTTLLYHNVAASWPLWLQIIVALLVIDFVQWGVHNLLHRVPFFWQMHKCHHSIVDGEMDWIVSFRFQWSEVVVYKLFQYIPLAYFGFATEAVLFHAIFGTLIGHLNHANLNWDYGWFRYVLNSPRMHIWHHDYEGDEKSTVNFGIIFSMWDWLFGTAKMPSQPPQKLGFHGVETFPKDFLGHTSWPLQQWLKPSGRSKVVGWVMGVVLLGVGLGLGVMPTGSGVATPMLGEVAASSQPSVGIKPGPSAYSSTVAQATAALAAFGTDARKAGFAHPEWMVSVPELAKALGSPRLVLLDVRRNKRFLAGRIPSAKQLYRGDYSLRSPYSGLSKDAASLQAMLRARGVNHDSAVVLYADGGPEAYRLWWTLRTQAGVVTRVLDGGLNAWKAQGHGVASGASKPPSPGHIVLKGRSTPALWSQLAHFRKAQTPLLLDTRSEPEYTGEKQHPKALRAGHIPGAGHLPWELILQPSRSLALKSPKALRELFHQHKVQKDRAILLYCQSGTRSSAVYFALLQAGLSETHLRNYDGSWAEYSKRMELPVSTKMGPKTP